MTVRILADRELYAAYAAEDPPEGCELAFGPASLDSPPPDFLVLPVREFLILPMRALRPPDCLVYGPVACMRQAFELGCADYLREPWSLPELGARLGRLGLRRFQACGRQFCIEASILRGEGAQAELGAKELQLFLLLLREAPHPVPREAAMESLAGIGCNGERALGRCVMLLRDRLESVCPGLGAKLHPVKGYGYRLDVVACG